MRFRITSLLLLAIFVLTGLASAQSLGAAARKERERREKNKQQGVAAREYSETEIFGDDEDPSEVDDESAGDSVEGASEQAPSSSSPLGDHIDVDVSAGSETNEAESRDRKLQEAEWRNRFRDARQRVAVAREQKKILDGVHHVEGMTLVDENGNVIVETLADLRALVDEASQELMDAERALASLEEESRRAGVPPGWRR